MSETVVAMPSVTDELLFPPDVFGIVQPGLFRSNHFHRESHSFLRTLRLKTVVSFRVGSDRSQNTAREDEERRSFFDQENVEQIQVETLQSNSHWRFSLRKAEERVKRVLEIILSTARHPVLITCKTGVHDTGVVVGCLRQILHWSFAAVVDENRGFAASAGMKTRHQNEAFVEMFDSDLVTLPTDLPEWIQPDSSAGEERSEMEEAGRGEARGAGEARQVAGSDAAEFEAAITARHKAFTQGPLVTEGMEFSVKLSICVDTGE
eukprot:g82.t1